MHAPPQLSPAGEALPISRQSQSAPFKLWRSLHAAFDMLWSMAAPFHYGAGLQLTQSAGEVDDWERGFGQGNRVSPAGFTSDRLGNQGNWERLSMRPALQ